MIELTDLVARVDGTTIVDRMTVRVRAGGVLALIGESGSGKTTTGLALLGETRPGVTLAGRVVVDGHDMLAEKARGLVGYVPQHPASALNPARRVGGVLAELARARPSTAVRGRRAGAREAVAAALTAAQLPSDRDTMRRFPHQFSGGQQQRLALAGALVGGPRVLVLDEPTTGLDPVTRRAVLDELAGLAAAGLTLVLLTHDLGAVRVLAEQIVVLRRGRVVEQGPVATLAAPVHAYTRELLAAEPQWRIPAPVPPAAALLRVAGLSARYGRRPALAPLDLSVPAGGRLGVVGASGSGKTTLGRCLAGLHEPATGTVSVRGEVLPARLDRRDLAQRRRVQYVFQDPHASFDQRRPVLDQVARTAIRLRGLATGPAHAEADALLTRLGVAPATAGRRPGGLSGGELQRAAIARALLAEPDVLVCDEVTSALDPLTQRALMDLLAGLATTLVLISHDLPLVAEMSDHLAVLADGQLVEHGPTAALLTDPRHPLTRAQLDALADQEVR
ncbi:ABC transporter ATP-binding protein [Longispora fulva]|uniref:Peptide/nickel transport system ATP-binding protein n=1 Tax=Longispora fulva TaxID=619741 RepID=A0A8J7GD20_9ACTN|nr:ATP-binding cassette domain-containing protein [Longispora fulva]MBG6136389.1 peptide/nickel transport system ATP-binding protein [Longispora fulva]GIG59557.1 ABC transporter ATP-binding protein [Longispora fulva]